MRRTPMARGRVLRGSWLVGLGVGLGLVLGSLPGVVTDAGAVLVCQNKKKAKLVALRGNACRKKENVALDLSGAVGSQGKTLTDQEQSLAAAETTLGYVCPNDATRKLVLSKFAIPPNSPLIPTRGAIRERAGGGCRTLDGNQAACDTSFQNNDPFTSNGDPPASSCFYFKGKCLSCTFRAAGRGGCANSCLKPRPTCADATRTVFAGGPGGDACRPFTTQVECEKAWHVGSLDLDHAATCYWTGSGCQGCGPRHANAGDCTETCSALGHVCKDPSRVTFVPGRSSSACHTYNADQTNCEKSFHFGRDGVATCWFDAASTLCNGCGLRWEAAGKCTNTCL
jgi:hypothetical protein